MTPLELSSSEHGDRTVIAVKGELDVASRDRFIAFVDGIIVKNGRRIILDLSQLGFMDTAALSTIASYWKRLTASDDGTLVLAATQYATARVLWITGLAQRLPMYDSVDEALAALDGS